MAGDAFLLVCLNRERPAVDIGDDGIREAPRRQLRLVVQAKSGLVDPALDQTEEILRNRRNVKFSSPNDFDLKTGDAFIGQFDSIFGMVGMIAIAISGVGLLVGGIGVMNIMLVSVTERTQEIGVRKAIGARRRDIVYQFLYEAMTLTLLGGLIGVLLSFAVSQIIMFFVPSLPASIPSWAVISGLTVSVAVGLIFGVWPARRAEVSGHGTRLAGSTPLGDGLRPGPSGPGVAVRRRPCPGATRP